MNLPEDLRYTKEHEWIKKESDTSVRIGITDFAQDELGDVVFVELPEAGDSINKDEAFASVESVKTVSELYAPVNGTIVETNEKLEDSPELVNESPYEKAWMIIVELDDISEWDNLLSAREYKAIIEEN